MYIFQFHFTGMMVLFPKLNTKTKEADGSYENRANYEIKIVFRNLGHIVVNILEGIFFTNSGCGLN